MVLLMPTASNDKHKVTVPFVLVGYLVGYLKVICKDYSVLQMKELIARFWLIIDKSN